jgi:hypothetical protein
MLRQVLKYLTEQIKKIIRAHLTALFLKAAQSNNAFYARLLLILGADVNAKDAYGNTALHMACRFGMKQLFEVLITRQDLDISINDANGQLAIYLADANNYPEATNRLLIMDIGQMANIPSPQREIGTYWPYTVANLNTLRDISDNDISYDDFEIEHEVINTPHQKPKSILIKNPDSSRLKRENRVKTKRDSLTIKIDETPDVHYFKEKPKKAKPRQSPH